jgi:bifunctional DNA-binding transcriptional regulator/antitoxin component of YhaV-PrlF toxin-antitoxin module
MSYELSISTKNQVTLPVSLLRDMGILPKSHDTPQKLIISKNFDGRYELVNPAKVLEELLNTESKSSVKLSDSELEQAIEESKNSHFKNKYTAKNVPSRH